MIDIDKYLNITLDIKINGEIINIKQPSAKLTKAISEMEKEINEENYLELKTKIAMLLLNNNNSNKIFTLEDADNIPFQVQDIIIKEISNMITKAKNDPN